jgi:hypothetical protein
MGSPQGGEVAMAGAEAPGYTKFSATRYLPRAAIATVRSQKGTAKNGSESLFTRRRFDKAAAYLAADSARAGRSLPARSPVRCGTCSVRRQPSTRVPAQQPESQSAEGSTRVEGFLSKGTEANPLSDLHQSAPLEPDTASWEYVRILLRPPKMSHISRHR